MIFKKGLLNKKVFTQALLALTFNIGGLLSGRLTIIYAPIFKASPWILAIYPLVLTVRGGTSGVLCGKLGTLLHTGEITPYFRGNTKSFYSLINSIFVLTFIDTLSMGLISFCLNFLFQQTALETWIYFVILPVLSCVLGVVVTIPITLFVGSKAFQFGLDPDIITYPTISTINDIIVSTIYIAIVSSILHFYEYLFLLEFLIIIIAVFSIYLFIRHSKERIFNKTLKEGIPILFLSGLFGSINGIILSSFRKKIENAPSILLLYPALMNILGNIGSIIGSMETTKLALGYVTSFIYVLKDTFVDLFSVEVAAFIIHIFLSAAVIVVGSLTNLAVTPFLIFKVALLSNILSFFFISLFSLIIATQTFKHGLDPDNFVIPLTTSISDTISTFTLMTVLIIVGVN